MTELEKIYSARFGPRDLKRKNELWRILCEAFLQRFVQERDRVLDVGAGYCEFINHIRCGAKYAVDVSSDTRTWAGAEVTVYATDSTSLPMFAGDSIDVVFCSNFLEHLPDKDALRRTLREVRRILRLDGKLIVIQPNIKYAFREYWDFWDHHLPLSHLSMQEILTSQGFQIDVLVPRFLPYTTRSRLPQTGFLLRLYLGLPFLWRLLGKQMLIVAHKVASEPPEGRES